MNKIDKNKLKNINGGGLIFDPGHGHVEAPTLSGDRKCMKSFDYFSCGGCFFCTCVKDPTSSSIFTYTCQNGFYNTLKYDLSKNKIID